MKTYFSNDDMFNNFVNELLYKTLDIEDEEIDNIADTLKQYLSDELERTLEWSDINNVELEETIMNSLHSLTYLISKQEVTKAIKTIKFNGDDYENPTMKLDREDILKRVTKDVCNIDILDLEKLILCSN